MLQEFKYPTLDLDLVLDLRLRAEAEEVRTVLWA